jgi:hypothetical protein
MLRRGRRECPGAGREPAFRSGDFHSPGRQPSSWRACVPASRDRNAFAVLFAPPGGRRRDTCIMKVVTCQSLQIEPAAAIGKERADQIQVLPARFLRQAMLADQVTTVRPAAPGQRGQESDRRDRRAEGSVAPRGGLTILAGGRPRTRSPSCPLVSAVPQGGPRGCLARGGDRAGVRRARLLEAGQAEDRRSGRPHRPSLIGRALIARGAVATRGRRGPHRSWASPRRPRE